MGMREAGTYHACPRASSNATRLVAHITLYSSINTAKGK